MVTLVNRAKVATATTGTGTITLGSAESGYQTFADAGLTGSDTIRYTIEDGDAWEIGTGGLNAAVTTMSRTLIESSTGSKLILSGDAVVYVTAAGQDIVQPSDLATVATTGAYSDLSGLPTLGTAAATDATAYATAAQGSLADSAVQPNDSPSFGSVTVTGTVDGRDVAADGSKLDGIEAGATADQTASEILTSIKTVDGSGSGLDADLLDGIHASSFLQGNQTITLSGDVSGSGTTSISVTVADDSHNHVISNVDGLQAALDAKLDDSQKGAANGLAELDATGKVPSAQLPSYVDDVLEYANAGSFPATGEAGKLYVALDSNDVYRWTGSAYVKVSDAVSTADQATKLATARNIALSGDVSGSANFDGSANISITATVADDSHNHIIGNVDGLQAALDGKLSTTGKAADSNLLDGLDSTAFYLASNPNGYTTNVGDITGVTAGSGITGGGISGTVTVSHADTSAQSSVNNSGATFIQDVTVDTYGHVTGLGSATITPATIGALSTSGKAADSNLLDGLDSTAFYLASNPSGYTSNVGDITNVSAGIGLSGGGASGSVTLNVDLSELTDMTAAMIGTDEFIVLDAGADRRKAANEIGLSIFSNDAGFTTNVGDITGVTAGSGISGGGTSGTVTVSHADTSAQGSVNNSGATVIQDVTLDTYGHVTALGSKTLTAADVGAITGNQTITLSGDVSGSGTTSISVTVADDSHNHSSSSGNFTVGGDLIATDILPPTDNTGVVGNTSYTWSNGQFTNLQVNSTLTVRGAVDLADNDYLRLGSSDDFRMWHNGTDTYFRNYLHAAGSFYWQGEGTGGVNHNLLSMHNDVATPYVKLYYDSAVVLETVSGGINIAGNTAWHAGNDGSGSGLDADLLDGQQGSYYYPASNPNGYTSNVGDITGVTAGTGLSGGGSSGSVTLNVDLSELTDMTAAMIGTDEFIVLDAGADRRKAANEIGLSIFNNDAGYTTNVGDITGVTAGTGLSGGGTSGTVTLSHADTSTLSGVYGSTADGTKIDTITVDANGHVTAVTTGATGDIQGVTAGSGITGGGTSGTVTISHADTSSQGSVNNSGTTFIQDITLDTYGHITSIGSATVSVTPPTTYGAVGTYVTAVVTNNDVAVSGGSTYSGSSLLMMRRTGTYSNSLPFQEFPQISQTANAGLSGTWRLMSPEVRVNFSDTSVFAVAALFVRIS